MSIDELAERMRYNDGTAYERAIDIFKYFLDCAKHQTIDEEILTAILHDAGEL